MSKETTAGECHVDLGINAPATGIHIGNNASIAAICVATVPAWVVVAGDPSALVRIETPQAKDTDAVLPISP
jgi:serine acetyltransferase